jgi:hypothetical protein
VRNSLQQGSKASLGFQKNQCFGSGSDLGLWKGHEGKKDPQKKEKSYKIFYWVDVLAGCYLGGLDVL